jgi:hypothetical protein
LALTQRIEADLRALEKLRIKPVFVFPGLTPNRRWKAQQGGPNNNNPMGGAMGPGGVQAEYTEACRDRRDAWAKYEAGQEEGATKLFEGRAAFAQWDLWRMVLRIFRHRNVEFIVAPYCAWAQLIYLQRHPKQYVHAIYGSTDTLLYPGVDKLITGLDLAGGAGGPTFTFVSKRALVGELTVTEDQFLDVAILVGFTNSPPFPPTMHEQALKVCFFFFFFLLPCFLFLSSFCIYKKLTQRAGHSRHGKILQIRLRRRLRLCRPPRRQEHRLHRALRTHPLHGAL